MDNIQYRSSFIEIIVRFFLLIVYLSCDVLAPFTRVIQPEEFWLYRFPRSESYMPMSLLWILAILIPCGVILLRFSVFRDKADFLEALWCFSLIISLNGALTNLIKIMVGRPRPDFLERCFPDGNYLTSMQCSGDYMTVIDGRKSFPSGHSSVAFASFGFLSLYLAGKLKLFTASGKSSSVKILIVITPVFFALCVAISRTCDYHHHWQDVLVGSVLGAALAYLCYFQYYPPLSADSCNIPCKCIPLETKMDSATRVKEV